MPEPQMTPIRKEGVEKSLNDMEVVARICGGSAADKSALFHNRLTTSWLAQRALLEEVAKEDCLFYYDGCANHPDRKHCSICRARALVGQGGGE